MDTVNTHGEAVRSPSVQSKESEVDINLPPDTEPTGAPDSDEDDVLSEEESFMTLTKAEQLAWEEMIKRLEVELKRRGEDFSEWSDKITRRRMYAYTRMKKLEKINHTRRDFYGNIDEFIQTFHGDVLKSDDGKSLHGEIVAKSDTQIQTVTDAKDDGNRGSKETSEAPSDSKTKLATDTPVIKEVSSS